MRAIGNSANVVERGLCGLGDKITFFCVSSDYAVTTPYLKIANHEIWLIDSFIKFRVTLEII